MARYRKGSGNTLPNNPNAGLAQIKNQRFNQAVPKAVSSMEGLNVQAGTLLKPLIISLLKVELYR